MRALIVIIALLWVFWYVGKESMRSDEAKTDTVAQGFTSKGYFKSKAKDRIFTIQMNGTQSADNARKYAKNKAHTAGHMTAVYFYDPSAMIPIDGVTLAKNVFDANRVLYDVKGLSQWRYAYMHHRNGSEVFVDCTKIQSSEFCRK